jgi:hypothetical protein
MESVGLVNALIITDPLCVQFFYVVNMFCDFFLKLVKRDKAFSCSAPHAHCAVRGR